ncbi:MAG: putative 2-aminoethylphosphonate transport system permease protein PhnU [Herbaspirillum frisingense]|uniref:Putative 2-aminoethylphosphonate transport system permease protein PhnU n=1 Tax=Herbaspirillum frisingense TaxID=92645 RepID=A0A7V8JT19_9BURK|nr:MAG: putative 2-aminoethylphosphonate transport system permease protein PhnU [Herbaspirillum frisingense]
MHIIGLLAVLIALPILGILGAWFGLDAAGIDSLRQQMQTVLPGYLATSGWLALMVTLGVILVGGAGAVAVSLFEFRGKRFLSWALLLPMAMPAYVSAYAYTDFLQYAGAVQSTLRGWFPSLRFDVRGLPGAICMFVFTLYPYAYLLARNALSERGTHLMEAARMLGTPLPGRIVRVALPLARPALMAGAALALMETLADYGVSAYFGLTTFTTGIYKAWVVLDDRIAAAQYASALLLFVAVLLWLERREQGRMRFAATRGGRGSDGAEARLPALTGGKVLLAWLVCGLPVLLGFVLPVLILLQLWWGELGRSALAGVNGGQAVLFDAARYAGWVWNSFRFGGIAALAALVLALSLSFALRAGGLPRAQGWLLRGTARLAGMGYAIPGSVIAIGILLPVAWLQALWPAAGLGVLLTASSLGVIYAYLVRFTAVAVQSVESGYTRIPASLDEAARTLGSSRGAIAWRVHMPLLWRSLAVAALMVFVDVVKELPATLLLRPFDTDTLAVIAHNLARDERLGEAALPALSIVAVGLIPVLLVTRALDGSRRARPLQSGAPPA